MADEQLILVDEGNRAVGTAGKDAVHRSGLLHRAFSIFIVDDARAGSCCSSATRSKYHSGGLWANSCCGHPRPGRAHGLGGAAAAATRSSASRNRSSFGFFSPLSRRPRSRHAGERIRLCLFRARFPAQPNPDPAEVADGGIRERSTRSSAASGASPTSFTYWLRHYFQHHLADIARHAGKAARSAPSGDGARCIRRILARTLPRRQR